MERTGRRGPDRCTRAPRRTDKKNDVTRTPTSQLPGQPYPTAPEKPARERLGVWDVLATTLVLGGTLTGCDDSTDTADAAASTTATAQSTATEQPRVVVETEQPTTQPPVATTPPGV